MSSQQYGTTVRLAEETADELHDRKDRGQSYDDVVTELLADHDHLTQRVEELEQELAEIENSEA